MGNPLSRPVPGQPFNPHPDTFNTYNNAARKFLQNRMGRTGLRPPSASVAAIDGIEYTVYDSPSVIVAGERGALWIPFSATITSATILADQPGGLVFDIKKCAYADYPSGLASIVASAPPTLSSAQKYQDTTLTGWTRSIAAGDCLAFYVTGSPSAVTWAVLGLKVQL
jgi:hypothetical protein